MAPKIKSNTHYQQLLYTCTARIRVLCFTHGKGISIIAMFLMTCIHAATILSTFLRKTSIEGSIQLKKGIEPRRDKEKCFKKAS